MPICRTQLRNTFNALTFQMFGEQICLQVPPNLFGVDMQLDRAYDQAVNSRLLVRRQKMHAVMMMGVIMLTEVGFHWLKLIDCEFIEFTTVVNVFCHVAFFPLFRKSKNSLAGP